MNERINPGDTVRHFKGNLYQVLYFARDSETREDVVVYRALYGEHGVWVRPKAMFTTCYANVPEEIEEEVLSKYGDFVRNLYDNTVTVNRIFTGRRNRRSLLR